MTKLLFMPPHSVEPAKKWHRRTAFLGLFFFQQETIEIMKNCKRFLVAGGVLVLAGMFAAAPAVAQPYGGLSLGISTSSDVNDLCDAFPGASCTKNPMGFKLFGGNQFNPNFAVEGGYYSTGDFEVDTTKISASSFFVQAVGIMPIQPSISIFGKIGLHFWKAEATGTPSEDGTDPVFGIGAKFALSRTSAIRAEYEQYKATAAGDSFNVNFLSVGYEMKF